MCHHSFQPKHLTIMRYTNPRTHSLTYQTHFLAVNLLTMDCNLAALLLKAGLRAMCLLLLFLISNDTWIPVRPIISKSTGPIFAEFARLVRDVAMATTFCLGVAGRRRLVAQRGGLTLGFAVHLVLTTLR